MHRYNHRGHSLSDQLRQASAVRTGQPDGVFRTLAMSKDSPSPFEAALQQGLRNAHARNRQFMAGHGVGPAGGSYRRKNSLVTLMPGGKIVLSPHKSQTPPSGEYAEAPPEPAAPTPPILPFGVAPVPTRPPVSPTAPPVAGPTAPPRPPVATPVPVSPPAVSVRPPSSPLAPPVPFVDPQLPAPRRVPATPQPRRVPATPQPRRVPATPQPRRVPATPQPRPNPLPPNPLPEVKPPGRTAPRPQRFPSAPVRGPLVKPPPVMAPSVMPDPHAMTFLAEMLGIPPIDDMDAQIRQIHREEQPSLTDLIMAAAPTGEVVEGLKDLLGGNDYPEPPTSMGGAIEGVASLASGLLPQGLAGATSDLTGQSGVQQGQIVDHGLLPDEHMEAGLGGLIAKGLGRLGGLFGRGAKATAQTAPKAAQKGFPAPLAGPTGQAAQQAAKQGPGWFKSLFTPRNLGIGAGTGIGLNALANATYSPPPAENFGAPTTAGSNNPLATGLGGIQPSTEDVLGPLQADQGSGGIQNRMDVTPESLLRYRLRRRGSDALLGRSLDELSQQSGLSPDVLAANMSRGDELRRRKLSRMLGRPARMSELGSSAPQSEESVQGLGLGTRSAATTAESQGNVGAMEAALMDNVSQVYNMLSAGELTPQQAREEFLKSGFGRAELEAKWKELNSLMGNKWMTNADDSQIQQLESVIRAMGFDDILSNYPRSTRRPLF